MSEECIIAIDPGDKNVGIITNFVPMQLSIQPNQSSQNFIESITDKIELVVDLAISLEQNVIVIIEDFKLYRNKAEAQSWSQLKTSQMIGALMLSLGSKKIQIILQQASQAKVWNDERLLRLGFIKKEGNKFYWNLNTPYDTKPLKKHTRDAVRHLIYYTNKKYFEGFITPYKLKELLYTEKKI